MQSSHRFHCTFGIEEQLPRVPLPRLEDSCVRFLEWCAPLLTEDELARTRAEVEQFLAGPGPGLHAALVAYNESGVASWLDRFWKTRYLGTRARIALNWNFFFLFADNGESQVDRAAGLIASAVHYKTCLDAETIPPAVYRGRPQSMVQHKYLFGTTRIPGFEEDTARTPYSEQEPGPARARHVVVFYRNNLFRMDVISPGGKPYAVEDMKAGLRLVMEAGVLRAEDDMALGALTTKARAEWAASREALCALDSANAQALDVVESALFCLCLEDFAPADTHATCDQLLHGNSGNRWFDKAVSLIVFADGRAGVNLEHCELDGITTVAFVDALLTASQRERSGQSGAIAQGPPLVERVEFVLNDALRKDVRGANDAFKDYSAGISTHLVCLPDFGSERIKALGMSPDAFVQLAYQLAHHRSRGLLGSTYESIGTRHWRHGRTEAMRVVTPECVRFVGTMADPSADAMARGEAFRAAAGAHVARTKQCQAGDAPEQHLAELLLIHMRRGGEAGDLPVFSSPGWLTMRDAYLSTSSASSENIQYFGFGPTGTKNIGVPYVLLPDRLNIYLSAKCPTAGQMRTFADRLKEAVFELEQLLAS
ncbi:carnitine O-acetyltransferase [Mesorhizobium sp. LNHC220B00]|nr:choline/carnitine O-acyltransferase [Mesorhizobium sp. LNHC220B00]ESY85974.1 carnitine O-acetyltransferase [Mesorhizobium sp. LNHC220B00]